MKATDDERVVLTMMACETKMGATRFPGFGFRDLIMRRGAMYTPTPGGLPDDYPRGPLGACYANAYGLALVSDEYVYVEGYAMRQGLIPMWHAWCVHKYDDFGKAADPTWEDGTAYFGIALDLDYVSARIEATGLMGVFAGHIAHEDLPTEEQILTRYDYDRKIPVSLREWATSGGTIDEIKLPPEIEQELQEWDLD